MSGLPKYGNARKWSSLVGVMCAVGVIAAMVGCSGEKKEASESGTFSAIYANTLSDSTCLTCHQPGTPAYDTNGVLLDFRTSASAYSTLTSLNAAGSATPSCNGNKLVVAGSAATSYLAAVISETYANNYSACTPLNTHHDNYPSTQAEVDSIIAWIQNGAQNN